jgi:hypothetical protein
MRAGFVTAACRDGVPDGEIIGRNPAGKMANPTVTTLLANRNPQLPLAA